MDPQRISQDRLHNSIQSLKVSIMFHNDPVAAAVFPIASFVLKAVRKLSYFFGDCFFNKLLCHIHLHNLFISFPG